MVWADMLGEDWLEVLGGLSWICAGHVTEQVPSKKCLFGHHSGIRNPMLRALVFKLTGGLCALA